jgi:hypothetical protein
LSNFFRLFSPINQLLGILVLILFWKSVPSIRMFTGAALVMYLVAEAMTFGYFYPRNAVLFSTASLTDIDLLKKTWSQWNSMNWVRSGVLLTGIIFLFWPCFGCVSLSSRLIFYFWTDHHQ